MSEVLVSLTKSEDELTWNEVPRPEGDDTPPGEDVVLFESADGKFTAGLWRRPLREGAMTRPFHEVSVIIDGIVEIVDPDGTVYRAEPGDILVTPRGSDGTWRCVTDVKKFWAICETDEVAPGTFVVRPGDLEWETTSTGEEVTAWSSADGKFSCGYWRSQPEEGPMEPSFHEMMQIIEGEITVTDHDGTKFEVGPGDSLIVPTGSQAVWSSHSPVHKFWAIYKGE
ncbi:MAG: cupin domain-containing protein [Actinobacteria bacterium]|nr:cupin domain-containing protein [Actinomycetota bacterium]